MHSPLRLPRRPSRLPAIPCLLVLALLLISALAQPSNGQAASDDDKTLFARPYIIRVMKADPWMGGVWLATDGGLFFKDMQSGRLRIHSASGGMPSRGPPDPHRGRDHA